MAQEPPKSPQDLAEALCEAPEDPRSYRRLSKALIAFPQPLSEPVWQQILSQSGCNATMAILAHEAASTLMSGKQEAVATLVAHMRPVLDQILLLETPPKPALLFLLTIRAVAGNWLDQSRLQKLHLAAFDSFDADDRALPYSVAFNASLFDRNRREILEAHWPDDAAPLHRRPDELLFFTWLSHKPAFDTRSSEPLVAYVNRYHSDPTQRPALKTLILRYAPVDMGLPLADWGMTDLEPLRHANPPQQAIVARFRSKPYQAVQLAHQKLPFLTRANRRVRVAVCVSGQLRGYRQASASWYKSLLSNVDTTVFVHSWRRIGRAEALPYRQVLPFAGHHFAAAYRKLALARGMGHMYKSYPTLFNKLEEDGIATEDQLKAHYSTDHIILDDESAAPFEEYSNQQKMHAKLFACDQLAREAGEFDLHLRIRPDLNIPLRAFGWADMRDACHNGPRLFVDHPFGLHYGSLVLGDQFAIGTSETMAKFAGAWQRCPALATAELAGAPQRFTGHSSLAISAWTGGLQTERAPVKFGKLLDAHPLNNTDIKAAIDADSRGDKDDQLLHAAILKDLSS